MSKRGFHEGTFEFTFANGDQYSGEYCAHVSGLAWRQGTGSYKTHDGHLYEGTWKDDKLNEAGNIRITFANGDEYWGKTSKYKYNGAGTYHFANGCSLSASFSSNRPVGDVFLIDRQGNLWCGEAKSDKVGLCREHIFIQELDEDRGKGRSKIHSKSGESLREQSSESCGFSMRDAEMLTFAKSFKTSANISYDDSDWVKEYEENRQKYQGIMEKMAVSGHWHLTEEEQSWHKQYMKSKKLLQDRHKTARRKRSTLLKNFLEERHKDTCKPVTIFFAKSSSCEEEGMCDGE